MVKKPESTFTGHTATTPRQPPPARLARTPQEQAKLAEFRAKLGQSLVLRPYPKSAGPISCCLPVARAPRRWPPPRRGRVA